MTGTTFLVVEDDENDAEFLRTAFRRAGPDDRLQIVRNGEEAVRYLSGAGEFANRSLHPTPDVVITDLKMPHMNGLELLRLMQADTKWRQVPRVVLTSSTAPADVSAAFDLGAAAYLIKPVALQELNTMAKAISDFWRLSIGLSRLDRLR